VFRQQLTPFVISPETQSPLIIHPAIYSSGIEEVKIIQYTAVSDGAEGYCVGFSGANLFYSNVCMTRQEFAKLFLESKKKDCKFRMAQLGQRYVLTPLCLSITFIIFSTLSLAHLSRPVNTYVAKQNY
jgi:hypothetical protein